MRFCWYTSIAAVVVSSCPSVVVDAFQPIARSKSITTSTTAQEDTTTTTTIVPPGSPFRDTKIGHEVSVVSFNVLAPSYHFLGRTTTESEVEEADRLRRIPQAIEWAKSTNADILLLQEVEGGEYENLLKTCLQEPTTTSVQGYDSYVWSALYPNRQDDDCVGLAVAWRSSRFRLVNHESFRRGCLVQLQEKCPSGTGANLILANWHLFAKPSAIEGRIKTVASTIRRIQELEHSRNNDFPLDGTIIVAGDLNCDYPSVTTRLLTQGKVPHGNVRDRNYKAKISKSTAAHLRQPFPFSNVYSTDESIRRSVAPVTVSLQGRGPGCMDHMLFVSGNVAKSIISNKRRRQTPIMSPAIAKRNRVGRRKLRRDRARRKTNNILQSDARPMTVESVLATIDPSDTQRTRIIMDGLPNEEEGFPSDHLPIGALLAPDRRYSPPLPENFTVETAEAHFAVDRLNQSISPNARKRRRAYAQSVVTRRRHNTILRAIAEWLLQGGATEMVRDRPLYKWTWTQGVPNLRKKMRAPDLCCVLGDTLVVVEVTVGTRTDEIRKEKLKKYRDLAELLRTSPSVTDANLSVAPVYVLAFDENGVMPPSVDMDLSNLQKLLLKGGPSGVQANCENVSISKLKNTLVEILRDFSQSP